MIIKHSTEETEINTGEATVPNWYKIVKAEEKTDVQETEVESTDEGDQ